MTAGWRLTMPVLTTLVDRANRVSSYEATGLLSDALELVRGVPFDAVGYDWAHEHQHHARACELIETAGLRLVDLALEADDVATARTAVSRALTALKINEPLYRARMKIEAHAGNTAGVRSVYNELVSLMNDLDPTDQGAPSTQTTQLFRSLNTSAAAAS